MKVQIESEWLTDLVGNEVREMKHKKKLGLSAAQKLMYPVMETRVDGVVYYCCWSGGALDHSSGQASFTEIGRAAFEALSSLPVDSQVHIQEIRLGKVPLRDKVVQMIREKPAGSRICFLGDMAGELDGEIFQAFNVLGSKEFSQTKA